MTRSSRMTREALDAIASGSLPKGYAGPFSLKTGRQVYVPLFQEALKAEGGPEWRFWMLVGCILVNQTRWSQARPVFEKLRRQYPTQWRFSLAHLPKVMEIVRPLGLYERRAQNLVRLAQQFDRHLLYGKERSWVDVKSLPGCGEYAHASWCIFVLGRRVLTDDKRLTEYLNHTAWG